jgi:hypothetical protein
LIREFFSENITFYFSGIIGKNITNAYQLKQFDVIIEKFGGGAGSVSTCWADAFRKLQELIEVMHKKRQVIFIDELPWLDASKSDFVPALGYFWNTFASSRPDVMLVVCGSAASWVVKNIFQNKGGLHNRITGRISLAPFTLNECEAFYMENGVVMNRYQVAESYMVFGGIPYYMGMFERGFGLTQNIDRLLFADNAPLQNEFNEVYQSLFHSSDRHIRIVSALAKKKGGMTRDEIITAAKIPGGGNLTKTLYELEQCSFIEKYTDFTRKKNNAYYRLVDPFTLFWLKYVSNNNTKDEYFWTNRIDDGGRRSWSGLAFEQLCLHHISQIKNKLGISGISTEVFSWRSKTSDPGAQIDLIISRRDGVINLCEMKYSLHPVTISAKENQNLHNKKIAFITETGTRNAIHITLVTTYGLSEKSQMSSIQSNIVLDDLFA